MNKKIISGICLAFVLLLSFQSINVKSDPIPPSGPTHCRLGQSYTYCSIAKGEEDQGGNTARSYCWGFGPSDDEFFPEMWPCTDRIKGWCSMRHTWTGTGNQRVGVMGPMDFCPSCLEVTVGSSSSNLGNFLIQRFSENEWIIFNSQGHVPRYGDLTFEAKISNIVGTNDGPYDIYWYPFGEIVLPDKRNPICYLYKDYPNCYPDETIAQFTYENQYGYPHGKYAPCVKIICQNGDSFTDEDCIITFNCPPEKPKIKYERTLDGEKVTYTFIAIATDKDMDPIDSTEHLKFIWDLTCVDLGIKTTSSSVYTPQTFEWPNLNPPPVKVKVVDSYGAESEFSDPCGKSRIKVLKNNDFNIFNNDLSFFSILTKFFRCPLFFEKILCHSFNWR